MFIVQSIKTTPPPPKKILDPRFPRNKSVPFLKVQSLFFESIKMNTAMKNSAKKAE